jgi:hypothetical protein
MRKLLLAVAVAMVVALVTFELEAGSLAGVSSLIRNKSQARHWR